MRIPARNFHFEEIIRKSRFIAHVGHVTSLAETLEFYESVSDPGASHNCWAWRLGHQYRFNDDGEPGGTAGKPILAAIDGKTVDQVMIVVTRYFGGVKLGVGGLVRAYGGTAAKGLDETGIREVLPRCEFRVQAAFNWTGQVYAALESLGAEKLSESHGDQGVLIRASLLEDDYERLKSLLRDSTRGEALLRRIDA